MATVGTVKTKALRMMGPGSVDQNNFGDDELYVYFNEALRDLSYELADSKARIAVTATTSGLTFTTGQYNKALPSDFIAEDRLFRSGTDTRLRKATQDQLDRWEDDTVQGTLSWYYTLGTSLWVNPRADVSQEVKLYYYPLQSISADTDTLPWGGLFDDAIMWHVLRRMHERAEMFGFANRDYLEQKRTKTQAWARAIQRDDFKIEPRIGWTQSGRNTWRSKHYLGYSDQF